MNAFRSSSFLLTGLACFATVAAMPPPVAQPAASSQLAEVDTATLTQGVREIAAPGIPGPLLAFGPRAFVVATGRFGDSGIQAAVVAGARLGNGRIIAFGHTGYLDREALGVGDTKRLLTNILHWAGRPDTVHAASPASQRARVRVGVLENAEFVSALAELGFAATPLSRHDFIDHLHDVDVLCMGQGPLDTRQIDRINEFIRVGHGLVMAGLGWGWLQLHPGQTLDGHPGNRLLAEAGLFWADGMLERTSPKGFSLTGAVHPDCHAVTALETLESNASRASPSRGRDAQASTTLLLAIRSLPDTERILLPRIRTLAAAQRSDLVPSEARPLRADAHGLQRVLLAYDIIRSAPPRSDHCRLHPAARTFPGDVPAQATRVTRNIEIDLAIPDWHGTGLYAAPGETIVVRTSGSLPPRGLGVRIGAHTDALWHHSQWKRVPEISRAMPLAEGETRIANPFGGLIYIECPARGVGKIRLSVANAVESPRFILNRSSLKEWKETIRHLPAPWAELESSKIIVTVPSESVRRLDDPQALMQFWDRLADAHATLAARPLERDRPERFVADVQISAGYMHAGYPIMTHLDAVADMTQLDRLRRGCWGLLHELGHNHQSDDWTFAGTGEVTCNLFTLHAIDTVCEPPAGSRGHKAVDRPPSFADYRNRGADFEVWKSDPFLALQMYVQLQAAFGWEPFKKVFAEYRALPAAQRPRTDLQKRDQWMMRFSRACGHNLGPFFDAWGVPTSAKARASLSDLSGWLPAGYETEPHGR